MREYIPDNDEEVMTAEVEEDDEVYRLSVYGCLCVACRNFGIEPLVFPSVAMQEAFVQNFFDLMEQQGIIYSGGDRAAN